jgi:dUTP pyrophosphatase
LKCTKHIWKRNNFNPSIEGSKKEFCINCGIERGNKYNTIKFKKLTDNAIIPQYMTDGSVGFDIFSNMEVVIAPTACGMITTGIAVEIPKNSEMTIRQRSGLSKKYPNYIAIGIGTIDQDYRGEIMIPIVNNNKFENFEIKIGDRIAQGIVSPIIKCVIEEVDKLSNTKRGTGGFGSTGGNTKH